MPGSFDLDIYRGDTGRWSFLLWKDAAKTDAVDLTGAVPRAQVRAGMGGQVLVDLACSITPPNRVDAVLPAATSATLAPVRGYWDLEITYSDGNVSTVLSGRACVTADVTRSAA
jgi:hypothetical protein